MNQDTLTTVKSILTDYPETRDNDVQLAFLYYMKSIPLFYIKIDEEKYEAMDVVQFFRLLASRDTTQMSSILRARRKIQENIESLRGKKWKARHRYQKVIIETVNKWEGARRHEVNVKYHDNKLPKEKI